MRRQWMPTLEAIKDDAWQPRIDRKQYQAGLLLKRTGHGVQMDTNGSLAIRVDLKDDERKEDAPVNAI